MKFNDALNRRLVNEAAVVPVEDFLVTQVAPVNPVTSLLPVKVAPGHVRPLRPGEIGTKTMQTYPDVPYGEGELRALLLRTAKGCQWLNDNLETAESQERLGLLCELLEATQLMVVAHMTKSILFSENGTEGDVSRSA